MSDTSRGTHPRTPPIAPSRRANRFLWAIALIVTGGCVRNVQYEALPPGTPEPATGAPVQAALYLVGDAGDDSPGRAAVLGHLYAELAELEAEDPNVPVVVVFLGDNIYDVGAREAFKEEDLAHLAAQVEATEASSQAHAVFLPGNHDWAKGAEDVQALEAIRIQERWLGELVGPERASFQPSDGCPGPAAMDLGPDVRLVFIDTEWLLRRPASACGTSDDFYADFQLLLEESADRKVVLTAHHPMATGGPHGGNIGAFHNGPFVYYLAVQAGLSVQDIASGRYSEMLERLRTAIVESGTRPLAFAAGHDHSLQVIRMQGRENPAFQLVSGSGSKTSPTDRIEGTRYASSTHGYMRLLFTPEQAHLTVFGQSGSDPAVQALFACTLEIEDDDSCAEATRVADR